MNSFLILSLSLLLVVDAGLKKLAKRAVKFATAPVRAVYKIVNPPNNNPVVTSTHAGPDLQHLLVVGSLTADAAATSFTSADSPEAIEAALKRVSVACHVAIDHGAVARQLSVAVSAVYEDYNFRFDSSFGALAKAHVKVRRTADDQLDVHVLFQCAAAEFNEAKDQHCWFREGRRWHRDKGGCQTAPRGVAGWELQWLETFLNFHADRKARTALLSAATTPPLLSDAAIQAASLLARDEWVYLESALARGSVLDSTTSAGPPAPFVHVWTKYVGAPQQQWQAFNHGDDGCFNLRTRHSGQCLDLAHYCGKNCHNPHDGDGHGDNKRLGAPFVTWPCHGEANQRICAVPHDDGSVSLVVKLNWFTVDLANRNTANGTPFVAWPADGEPKQRFFLSRAQQ